MMNKPSAYRKGQKPVLPKTEKKKLDEEAMKLHHKEIMDKKMLTVKNNLHMKNLYEENMRRVDADDSYFFSDKYYQEILSSDDFESVLKLCIHNETQSIIGAAIFIKTGDIVQYHLSGLSEDTYEVDPIKLIIDEARIEATDEGYKIFNLGGGRGSNEDSLFRFKSGFSKDFKDFKVWKYIVDEEAYKNLVKNRLGTTEDIELSYSGFFPAYRAKLEVTAS